MQLTLSSTPSTETPCSTNENGHLVLEYDCTAMFVPCFDNGRHRCGFAFIKDLHKAERNFLSFFFLFVLGGGGLVW